MELQSHGSRSMQIEKYRTIEPEILKCQMYKNIKIWNYGKNIKVYNKYNRNENLSDLVNLRRIQSTYYKLLIIRIKEHDQTQTNFSKTKCVSSIEISARLVGGSGRRRITSQA